MNSSSLKSLILLVGATTIITTRSFAAFIPMKIATGWEHTCALSAEGQIKCWGSNSWGELGTGDLTNHGDLVGTMGSNLPFVNLGLAAGDKAMDICAGEQFTCASTQKGDVKCWGKNVNGELGQGSLQYFVIDMGDAQPFTDLGKDFRVKSLSCGRMHVCALSSEGKEKCWGSNQYGALGLGDTKIHGRAKSDMGDNLPVLADLSPFSIMSAGHNHTCALAGDGLRCWGQGGYGQLGLESSNDAGNTLETMPSKMPLVPVMNSGDDKTKVLSFSSGMGHTCALMSKAQNLTMTSETFVKCWGYNFFGTLGNGSIVRYYGRSPNTMGANLPVADLGVNDIVALGAHDSYTCALTIKGRVKCWGFNQEGQLGLGDTKPRGTSPDELGQNLRDIDLGLPAKALSVGSASVHSCAILINNEVKCWGKGLYGRLGYESSDNVGLEPNQMGDNLPFVRL